MPDKVYYQGEDYQVSLRNTTQLWTELLNRPKLWSDANNRLFYDEIISYVNDLLGTLDLSYKLKHDMEVENEEPNTEFGYINTIEYVASNINDQQYFYRLVLFLDDFLTNVNKKWLDSWIPILTRSLIFKLKLYPRCLALLKLFTTVNEIAEDNGFYSSNEGEKDKDIIELCRMYYSELFEKTKEYQDELLVDTIKLLLSIPIEFLRDDGNQLKDAPQVTRKAYQNQFLKDITQTARKAFQLGLQNIYVANAALISLDRITTKLPLKKIQPFLSLIIPCLSEFLNLDIEDASKRGVKGKPMIADEVALDPKNSTFNLKLKESELTKTKLCNEVLKFLGKIGGLNHMIISSDFRNNKMESELGKDLAMEAKKENKYNKMIAWDQENTLTFPLPLSSKKVDISLSKILPRILTLVTSSTDRKTKLRACELLHTILVYMIGRSAERYKEKDSKSFKNLYEHIFPAIFQIAADVEDISTKIFNTLCLQIVRWFANSKDYENPEIATLLDTLINCVSVRDNSNLREFAAVCIGEFVKWTIKQASKEQLKENPGNIKSVIRRIQNNASHPDPYNRYGAILAIKQAIIHIREEDSLVEKYTLELAQTAITIIKMSHHSTKVTEEMTENMSTLLRKLQDVVIKKWDLLEKEDPKRGAFPKVHNFIDWVFDQIISYEKLYSSKATYLWEALVDNIIKKGSNPTITVIKPGGRKSAHDNHAMHIEIKTHREWIQQKIQKEMTIFKGLHALDLSKKKKGDEETSEKISLLIKNYQLLDSQLNAFQMLINKKIFKLSELVKYTDYHLFLNNVSLFFDNTIKKQKGHPTQFEIMVSRDENLVRNQINTQLRLLNFFANMDEISEVLAELISLANAQDVTLKNLVILAMKNLICPFEDHEILNDFSQKEEKERVRTCINFLKKVRQAKIEHRDDVKFFDDYFMNGFLKERPLFNFATRHHSLVQNLLEVNEFQLKGYFEGYECLFENVFEYQISDSATKRKDPSYAYINEVCENLMEYIQEKLPDVKPNQEEKIRSALHFVLKFSENKGFLIDNLDDKKLLFQKNQDVLFENIAKKFKIDGGELIKSLILSAASDDVKAKLLIPIFQMVLKHNPAALNTFPKFFEKVKLTQVIKAGDDINSVFLRVNYILLSNSTEGTKFLNDKGYQEWVFELININLAKDKKIFLINEAVTMLGLVANLMGDDSTAAIKKNKTLDKLKEIQMKYFPVHTVDYAKDTQDEINFRLLFTSLTGLVKISLRGEFLELFYAIIREPECAPKYEKMLTRFLYDFLNQCSTKLTPKQFTSLMQMNMKVYRDAEIDDGLKENIRWGIIKRVILPLMERTPKENLIEVMCEYAKDLENILKLQFKDIQGDTKALVMLVQEKSCAFALLEVLYRRLTADMIKGPVHKRLYGNDTQGNELTKSLIPICHYAKCTPFEYKDLFKAKEKDLGIDADAILYYYSCMAYNCVSSIIRATQTKDTAFVNFLFNTPPKEKNQYLWELIVPKREDFSFEVETNFNIVTVERNENELTKGGSNLSLNNIISHKYLSDSFFSQKSDHQGFLLFELTQANQKNAANRKSVGRKANDNIMMIEEEDEEEEKRDEIEEMLEGRPEDNVIKPQKKYLELDIVNQHPCMQALLRNIDHMHEHFPVNNSPIMPTWMSSLHSEAIRPDIHLSLKIFLIKVVINRKDIFQPYARDWCEVLLNYASDKNNGGKGFHYFLRDVCTTLVSWFNSGFKIDTSPENKQLCSKFMNQLIKVVADKSNFVFTNNLKIAADLMRNMAKLVYLEKNTINMMLAFDEKKEGCKLWRMSALIIVDLALTYKVPLCDKFQDFIKNDLVTGLDTTFLANLLKNLQYSYKNVAHMASAVVGRLLWLLSSIIKPTNPFNYPEAAVVYVKKNLPDYETKIADFLKRILLDDKQSDMYFFFIENISVNYSAIMQNRNVFFNCVDMLGKAKKKARAALLNALRILIDKTTPKVIIQKDIQEICMNLQASYDKITRDYEDDNLINFFKLVNTIVQIFDDNTLKLLENIYEDMGRDFVDNQNEQIVDIFFEIVMYVYDLSQKDEKLHNTSKAFLLKGLNHPLLSIRTKIFNFMNDENRVSLNPKNRLEVCLKDLYAPKYEELWLRSAVPLIINIAKKSSDYERKLFTEPLQEHIKFGDFDPSDIHNFKYVNKSQPLTPIFTLTQQFYEGNLASQQPNGTLAQKSTAQSTARNTGAPFQAGFVRATQLPMFSQTLGALGGFMTQDALDGLGTNPNQFLAGLATESSSGSRAYQNNDKANGQESEVAGPAISKFGRTYKANQFSQFLTANAITMNQMSVIDGNRIRFNTEGAQERKTENLREKQRGIFLSRQNEIRQKQLNTARKYRIGELPDIEISHKDLIDPLVDLSIQDVELSSELFISIFTELYKQDEEEQSKVHLRNFIIDILKKSQLYDYNVISTIHRVLLELIKRDTGIEIDTQAIAESGLKAFSYHTTVLLIEEVLIYKHSDDASKGKKARKTQNQKAQKVQTLKQAEFNELTAPDWLRLAEVYTQLNEEDSLKGLKNIILSDQTMQDAMDLKLNRNLQASLDAFNKILDKYESNEEGLSNLEKKVLEYLKDEKKDNLASLNMWDELLKDTPAAPMKSHEDTVSLSSLKDRDAFYLMKSLINKDEYWSTMADYVKVWMSVDAEKEVIESKFNYEVALLSLTQDDLDRSRLFLNKEKEGFLRAWKKFNEFSEDAQHKLIQKVQKMHEFNEFLSFVEINQQKQGLPGANPIDREFIRLSEVWAKRPPSVTFDTIHTWNDVLQSRSIFIDVINNRFGDKLQHIRDLKVAQYYEQTAKGLIKKGFLETAEKLLFFSLKLRNTGDAANRPFEYKTVASVIKLKLNLLENDVQLYFKDPLETVQRYDQTLKVLDSQSKKYEGRIDDYNHIKLNVLKVLVKERTMTFHIERYNVLKSELKFEGVMKDVAVNANFVYNTYNKILSNNYFTLAGLGDDEYNRALKRKIYSRYAIFAEKLLRLFDEYETGDEDPRPIFEKENKMLSQRNLGKVFIDYICDAFGYGYAKLEHLPKLFDTLLKFTDLGKTFKEKTKALPSWMYLKWLPQMMFIINLKEISAYIEDILLSIAELYPQALLYQFNVSFDKLNPAQDSSAFPQLAKKIQQKFDKFTNHYAFIVSLNQITHPEHRIQFYIDNIKEALGEKDPKKKVESLTNISKELMNDVFPDGQKAPYVGDKIGSYNRKFAKDWEKEFVKVFGKNLENLYKADPTVFTKEKTIEKFMERLKEHAGKIPAGKDKLNTFSDWLGHYDANNYLSESKIEIPGQYNGNSEPHVNSHVTISNCGANVLILSSIRRPKRLTVHGSNEKTYNFLVKGVEDLRTDQRVEQMFTIMNDIFAEDANCLQRELRINTFQVIPMTKSLGVLEWVDNTEPIKSVLQKEYGAIHGNKANEFDKNAAFNARVEWLNAVPGNKDKGFPQKHVALLKLPEKDIVDAFNHQQSLIPGDLLKKNLEKLCSSVEAFLYVRNKFIRNFATLSIACYILGIGDRHLENFLMNMTTGEVVGIDFGISFGSGLNQYIPELMPFRLTKNFETMLQPLGVNGLFRNTCVHTQAALRDSRNVLLDCCEIFIKDPLMDWLKMAKSKKGFSGTGGAPHTGGGHTSSILSSLGLDEESTWYPKRKVDIVRKKLVGMKGTEVMVEELTLTRHNAKNIDYYKSVLECVRGGPKTFRATVDKEFLNVPEQVDVLIDMARDPNILGRAWIGWGAYL